MSADFQLFTTIRYDGSLEQLYQTRASSRGYNHSHECPLYMLDYHRDRLLHAAQHFQWESAVSVLSSDEILLDLTRKASAFVGGETASPSRLKILVGKDGHISFEKGPVPETPLCNLYPARLPEPGVPSQAEEPGRLPLYQLLVDSAMTEASPFTHYKTTRRPMYDAARQRAGIAAADLKEVLLVNRTDGSVMEGSIFTPYFWRSGRWVTPPVSPQFDPERGSGGQDGTSRRWALQSGLAHEETVLASSLVDGEACWLSNGLRGFVPALLTLN